MIQDSNTGIKDTTGRYVHIGDEVEYTNGEDSLCRGVVKFGEYEQNGSGGEYGGVKCYGVYVERTSSQPPPWADVDDIDENDKWWERWFEATISPLTYELRVVDNE